MRQRGGNSSAPLRPRPSVWDCVGRSVDSAARHAQDGKAGGAEAEMAKVEVGEAVEEAELKRSRQQRLRHQRLDAVEEAKAAVTE